MKKYTNKSHEMRTVFFEDGSAQFLKRGQSLKTDKQVKRVQDGIHVTDESAKVAKKTTNAAKKATESEDTEK